MPTIKHSDARRYGNRPDPLLSFPRKRTSGWPARQLLSLAAGGRLLRSRDEQQATGWDPSPELGAFRLWLLRTHHGTVAKTVDGKRSSPPISPRPTSTRPFLHFGMMFGAIEKRPAFEAYVTPLMKRPAAIRAQEKAKQLMAKAAN